jgi:hypothetical protein
MERCGLANVCIVVLRSLVFLLALSAISNAQSAIDIIRRSVDRDSSNFERRRDYTYQQRQEERDFDANGKVKKSEAETREVMILAGRPYERLIARDDKPLSLHENRKEQEKVDRELERREHMGAADQAKLDKSRQETRRFLNEVPQAFNFQLLGEETVSGKPAWVIECDPKPGFHPQDDRAKLLSKVRGKVWIDQAEYQWVKAEMRALDTLSFGLGLFRVEPGGSISFEQTRVNGEIWLPTRAFIRADARLAYLKKVRAEIEITYRDYKKFQTDSRMVAEQK